MTERSQWSENPYDAPVVIAELVDKPRDRVGLIGVVAIVVVIVILSAIASIMLDYLPT